MNALIQRRYGSPDFLEITEIARPVPKENEVLVRIHAVSINDWDWGLLHGTPLIPNRLIGGLFKPKIVVGSDVAGRVEAVGPGVSRWKPGDEVFGDLSSCGFGGFAEFVCAHEKHFARKPESMSFEQAAAIPQAGVLLVQAIKTGGPINCGQRILINGAGGGCGTMGIQILKHDDVEVTGVDSANKLDLMRSLGFDHVIDYNQEDFARNGKQYDLIIDTKTSRPPSDIARALAPGGKYVTVGGNAQLLLFALFRPYLRWRYKKDMLIIGLKTNSELSYLCELFESGKFKPILDRQYRFTEGDVRAAFHRFGAGEQRGKIVVTVLPE